MTKLLSALVTFVAGLALLFAVSTASAAPAPVFNDFTTGAEGWSTYNGSQSINENDVLISCNTGGGYTTVSNAGAPNHTTYAEADRDNPFFVTGLFGGGDPGGSMTWKIRVYDSTGAQVDSADGTGVARTDPTQVGNISQTFEPDALAEPPAVALNLPGGVWPAGGSFEVRNSYGGIEVGDCLETDFIEQRFNPITPPPNQPPDADFSFAPGAPDVDELVTFTSTSSDPDGAADIVSHEWDVDGDGAFDITQGGLPASTDEAYQAPGDYDVTLRVTDAQDNTDTATKTVTVTDPTPPPPPPPGPASDPTGFVWDEASTTETTCVWEWNDNPAAENVDTYQAYPFNSASSTSWAGTWTDVTESRFVLSGLSPGTTRYLKVSAHNAVDYSDWVPNSPGAPVACTTDGVVPPPPPPPPPPPGDTPEVRPFDPQHPVYQPASLAHGQLDPNSAAIVSNVASNHAGMFFATGGDSPPIYIGQSSDPLWTWAGHQVRAPSNIAPAGGSDRPLIILDASNKREYRGWQVTVNSSARTISSNVFSISCYDQRNGCMGQGEIQGPPPTGSGESYTVGMIRPIDMARGRIDHAIRVSIGYPKTDFRWPAVKYESQNATSASNRAGMGYRMFLSPSANMGAIHTCINGRLPNSLNARAGRIIATAYQEFGQIALDGTGGGQGVYFEGDNTANWPELMGPRNSFGSYNDIARAVAACLPWSQMQIANASVYNGFGR